MTRQPAEDFLDTLAAELAAAGIDPRRIAEIRAEVEDHLSESVRAAQLQGQSTDTAWQQALARFGTPVELARRFAAAFERGDSMLNRLALLLARIGLRSEVEPEAGRVAAPMRRTPRTRQGWLAAGVALVLLSTGGDFAASTINVGLWNAFGDEFNREWLFNVANAIALWLTTGLLMGFGQWLVLRRWVDRARWWILASTAGWGGAIALGITMYGIFAAELRWEVVGVAITLPVVFFGVGLFQWLLLRRWVRRAGWWLLASGLSSVTPLVLSYVLYVALQPQVTEGGSSPAILALVPVLRGLFSGVALVLLFAQVGNPSQRMGRAASAVADTAGEAVARPRRHLALLGYT